MINPSNPFGISEDFVVTAIYESAEVWDSEVPAELFSDNYIIGYDTVYGEMDFSNEIMFGDISEPGVIGVTSIWYTRAGKKILDFDMKLNTNFVWGDAAVDSSVMDIQNIATHELGHAAGPADIYSDSCSHVTMYGYSGYGDTEKRTLESSDITGIRGIYG